MEKRPLYKQKTFYVGLGTVIGTIGAAIAGEITWLQAFIAIASSGFIVTVKDGVEAAIRSNK